VICQTGKEYHKGDNIKVSIPPEKIVIIEKS
jgi:hypothetical protein